MKDDPRQEEFDLVSPFLTGPCPLPDSYKSFTAGDAADRAWLEAVQARLVYEDIRPSSPATERELAEMRLFVGSTEWQRSKKIWRRRARNNPRRFRKVLMSLKKVLFL